MSAESSPTPRIAVFSGGTATIQNSPPLVTSNAAREKHGLPLLTDGTGAPLRFDILRPQRLAAPVTVYVEAFSAHPLERDAAELYAPPDGYIGADGAFHKEPQSTSDIPVYEVTLRPEDGLYLLPYMARQANGDPWDGDCAYPDAPAAQCRQPFYPDPSRIFEEIDRFGVGEEGVNNLLGSQASFDFIRAAPAGGYKKGLAAPERTDAGSGDIPPETLGEHFFPYRPFHIAQAPPMPTLARLTNVVQQAMSQGVYSGAIWLEGSPDLEETIYWLNLLIDTTLPIAGNASQRPHGEVSNDGDHNIIDSVEYILSRIWADVTGRDAIGAVVIQDEQIFTARDVEKSDARPGGYVATGGHGGVVGSMGKPGPPALTFRPVKLHTYKSAVNVTNLPDSVLGVRQDVGGISTVPVQIKDDSGRLTPDAIPKVAIVKHAHYSAPGFSDDPGSEVEILARIDANLRQFPLAGFVLEGSTPYAKSNEVVLAALQRAVLHGMPVVRTGRGSTQGITPADPLDLFVEGNNLTATKARLLLMACLMKFGSLPLPSDPDQPTQVEMDAIRDKISEYQAVFDTH